MVDPGRAEARSSPGETPSRFISSAAVLLLLLSLDAQLRIDGRPDSPSPMQLPRSDHRDRKVAISVNEFGAKGNGLDDDTPPCSHAPTAIIFHRSKHVILQDLNVFNSQQMHVAFTSCSHVRVSRLKVIAPAESPNTDGIHISESHSIVVENNTISTGDDCISIVGNSSNIQVKGIVCGPGHGISIGSLGKSNSFSEVHHILVEKSLIINTENGVRIKTWQGGSGYARNIIFRKIRMSNVSNPIIINQYYCDSLSPCENQTSAVEVHDIAFVGIKGTSATENAIALSCSDSVPCEKILLRDIQLSLESGGNATAYCWKASGSSSGLITPPSCLSSGFFNLIKQKSSSIQSSSSPSR